MINLFVSALAKSDENPLPGKRIGMRLASSSVHHSLKLCFKFEKLSPDDTESNMSLCTCLCIALVFLRTNVYVSRSKHSASFCGTHMGETEEKGKRVPCPVDPNHTVFEHQLSSHVKVRAHRACSQLVLVGTTVTQACVCLCPCSLAFPPFSLLGV